MWTSEIIITSMQTSIIGGGDGEWVLVCIDYASNMVNGSKKLVFVWTSYVDVNIKISIRSIELKMKWQNN